MNIFLLLVFAFLCSWGSGIKGLIAAGAAENKTVRILLEGIALILFLVAGICLWGAI